MLKRFTHAYVSQQHKSGMHERRIHQSIRSRPLVWQQPCEIKMQASNFTSSGGLTTGTDTREKLPVFSERRAWPNPIKKSQGEKHLTSLSLSLQVFFFCFLSFCTWNKSKLGPIFWFTLACRRRSRFCDEETCGAALLEVVGNLRRNKVGNKAQY